MVEPTMIAVFWLLLRPLVVLGGEGVVDGGGGVGVVALELKVVGGVVVVRVGGEGDEEGELGVAVTGPVALIFDAVGLAVVGFDVALDALFSPPSCGLVHSTGS